MSDNSLPNCANCGNALDSSHNCFKALGNRINRHRAEINKLEELYKKIQIQEGSEIPIEPVIQDIQYQLDELKRQTIDNRRYTKAIGRVMAATIVAFKDTGEEELKHFPELQKDGPSNADWDTLAEGSVVIENDEDIAPEADVTPEKEDLNEVENSSTEKVSDLNESIEMSSEVIQQTPEVIDLVEVQEDGELPPSPDRRTVRMIQPPPCKLGPITVRRPVKFTVTTHRVESSSVKLFNTPPKELSPISTEIQLTSNNMSTQGQTPGEFIKVLIEHANQTKSILVSKSTSSRELRQKIRQELNIPQNQELNVLYTQHRAIVDDDKSLWSLGMRFIPNHIAIIPDTITKGDQVKLRYISKGSNVNGNYEPFCKTAAFSSWG